MIENFEFVDIEPLYIMYGEEKWIHPFIHTWFEPNTLTEEERVEYGLKPDEVYYGYDDDVYRMYLENDKGDTIYVVFKSDYIGRKYSEWSSTVNFDDDEENWPEKTSLFEPPYINSRQVFDSLCIGLIEDVWTPMPKITDIDNIDVSNIGNGKIEQFCFTEFGKKISKMFAKECKCTFFSLDCGLTTDGKDWWFDS